jgi:hypothetical protein
MTDFGEAADELRSGRDPGLYTGPPADGLPERGETVEQRYLRHIRTSVVCIAVAASVAVLAIVAWSIYTCVQINGITNQINNFQVPAVTNSFCSSQLGSPGPNC